MQIGVFFVPLADGASELGELNSFLRGHRVLKVDHALVDGGWTFCVEWLEGESGTVDWKRKPRVDWKEKLYGDDRFAIGRGGEAGRTDAGCVAAD